MKKKMVIMLDVESCPIDRTIEEVDAHNMLVYDIGYRIIDLHNNVYCERSFIVGEIFFGEKAKMQTAYYASKIPQYNKDLKSGKRIALPLSEIRSIIAQDCSQYGVSIACAHNAYFDYTALRTTEKYLHAYYTIPKLEWWDTMKMARSVIVPKKHYEKFCYENNYITKQNRPQATAQALYRFISNNNDFEENHTGLEDVIIESEILWTCIKAHKKMNRKLWKD